MDFSAPLANVISAIKASVLWFWVGVVWIWDRRGRISRSFKYAYLFVALAITIKIVFDGFSFYLARRSIDAELDSKKISSLEYLGILAKRERAFVIDTLETRCTERNQLAMFRVLDAEMQQELQKAHLKSLELRSAIIVSIENIERDQPEWTGVVDLTDLKKEVRKATFAVALLAAVMKPAGTLKKDDDRYKDVSEKIIARIHADTTKEVAAVAAFAEMRQKAREKLGKDGEFFKSIELLERRLDRLKEARKENKLRLNADLDDVMSRYAVWTNALTGGLGDNPVLDELAFQIGDDDKRKITDINCDRFETFFNKVTGNSGGLAKVKATTQESANDEPRPAESATPAPDTRNPPPGDAGAEPAAAAASTGVWHDTKSTLLAAWRYYQGYLNIYFNIPPVAQTLFVTLLLGALGALTINALRLSKIGWWEPQVDPLWGEMILAPALGALAAFGIFLLGSTGLLLTGDAKSGVNGTSLSAFFIGMLGFISGLLYDEAFGRVRRFGSQVFAGDTPVVVNTAEDIGGSRSCCAARRPRSSPTSCSNSASERASRPSPNSRYWCRPMTRWAGLPSRGLEGDQRADDAPEIRQLVASPPRAPERSHQGRCVGGAGRNPDGRQHEISDAGRERYSRSVASRSARPTSTTATA